MELYIVNLVDAATGVTRLANSLNQMPHRLWFIQEMMNHIKSGGDPESVAEIDSYRIYQNFRENTEAMEKFKRGETVYEYYPSFTLILEAACITEYLNDIVLPVDHVPTGSWKELLDKAKRWALEKHGITGLADDE